jgi:hypothetical protein
MTATTPTDRSEYTTSIIRIYVSLPDTPQRAARSDWILANSLFDRQIDLGLIKNAFMLATVRRLGRSSNMPALAPIRSLHYFVPIVEELLSQPLPAGYAEYLENKAHMFIQTKAETSTSPAPDQKSTFSRAR